jgi:hypothetical protein
MTDDPYADLSRLPLDVAAAVRWAFARCEELCADEARESLAQKDTGEWRGAGWCKMAIAADLAARDRKREGGA